MIAPPCAATPSRAIPAAALARCLDCGTALEGRPACPGCGRAYPVVDGVLEALGSLTGRNRIAAAFYDGPGWARFQPWEQVFLWFQGPGPARARRRVLRFLPRRATARVLEVGIGDGANLPLLPVGWTPYGVDIARGRLDACRARVPAMAGRLVLAQAEALPFDDATFDAVFSVGGFNYFSDHAAALREIRRVAKPGAPVVVADERPDLFLYSIGNLIGLGALDRWALRAAGLDEDFLEMVLGHRIDLPALSRAVWPGHRRVPIWNRLGYCLVDPDPWPVRPPFRRSRSDAMALMTPHVPPSPGPNDWAADLDRLRCVACDGGLARVPSGADLACARCGRAYPVRDGVLVVRDEPEADNRIARDFYNGPLWPKFRFWERFFWACNGGERRSRDVILRRLPDAEDLALLDVAIGDGVYLPWLPASWSVTGIDISSVQLAACRTRDGATGRPLKLVLGEAEALPFRDRTFDAVLSIGGFNHFNDPEGALREMVRVARPGATIVVSDELPDLTDRMPFRKLGLPGLDRWIVARLMNLGDEFTDLVERHRDLDIAAIGRRVLADRHYEVIWRGGGYLMTGKAP